MAEFCFECYNKLHGGNRKKENYIISDELDLCEGCGEYKRVVISYKKNHYFCTFYDVGKMILFPFYLIRIVIYYILNFFIK